MLATMLDLTPTSKSHKSSDTSTLGDQAPSTPKLPFDPPRRRSSLAFSKIIDSPTDQDSVQTPQQARPSNENQPPTFRSNIGRKRTIETHDQEFDVIPGCAPKLEKVFQAARANLQLDMHFAASPIGSIASRLPQPARAPSPEQDHDHQVGVSTQTWRYSTVPKIFSALLSDVREPLPDASPRLPLLVSRETADHAKEIEPTSSGFASPVSDHMADEEEDLTLPPLPQSSSPRSELRGVNSTQFLSNPYNQDLSDLTQPMTGLKVGSDRNKENELMHLVEDDSPVIEHLRRKSGHSYGLAGNLPNMPDNIFLSKSAKAAAECARAKRGLVKETLEEGILEDDRINDGPSSQSVARVVPKTSCPDPQLHHYMATHPCPDPFAHMVLSSTDERQSRLEATRVQPRAWGNEYFAHPNTPAGRLFPRPGGRRTTAAGSPMPFTRRDRSPARDTGHDYVDHTHLMLGPPPVGPLLHLDRHVQHVPRHGQKSSEHFQPGWYYASESSQVHNRPVTNLYSFSTAAAKATGESAAPDLRIRDSYRTDTLTPLARPQGRFRKNGLAATLRGPGPRKNPRRGVPYQPSTTRAHQGQSTRYEPPQFDNIQFRSSPPRPSTHYSDGSASRKRTANDLDSAGFDTFEGQTAGLMRPVIRTFQSEEIMQVDDQTRAAVRMSLFGPNVLEHQQSEAQSMREISPNVKIWRKGRADQPHYRKKRRPSYWDDDLEEVRMSPAGRVGIQSSPPVSKRSVFAEVENTSSYVGSVVADHDDASDLGEEAADGVRKQTEVQEVNMADVVEHST